MKRTIILFAICCTFFFIFSCTSKKEIIEGVKSGMYDVGNQNQQMEQGYPEPESGKEPPTYEQYERERREMLAPEDTKEP